MPDPKRTPLFELHTELGAKMVPFAGWEMPLQYEGVMAEHTATRAGAGLFDVSHMGQVRLAAPSGRAADAAVAIETVAPIDAVGLASGRQRYTVLTNDEGGILDDLMVANLGDSLMLVLNAANAEDDIAHLEARLGDIDVNREDKRALLALQGPDAERILTAIAPGVREMKFMDVREFDVLGGLIVTRSGYTGEDGFEISIPGSEAIGFARKLLDAGAVPAGLGARDSLRLEAGLPLHGSDIDATTTPVEAGLPFAIGKARRAGGDREGGFPGDRRILGQLGSGPERRLVGLKPSGRAPMRGGTEVFAPGGETPIGVVTSGGFGPSVGAPIAMAYLPADLAAEGTRVEGEVRGKRLPAEVVKLPFWKKGYAR